MSLNYLYVARNLDSETINFNAILFQSRNVLSVPFAHEPHRVSDAAYLIDVDECMAGTS